MKKSVTERDLRDPKYGDGDPDEFEFRDDGSIARKDRWEMGIRSIASAVNVMAKGWEVKDVVDKVQELAWYTNLLGMEIPDIVNDWYVPKPLTRWIHRDNGNEYIILGLTNLESTQPEKYPVTIIYLRLFDGTVWNRPLDRWHADYQEKPKKV